MVKTCEVLNMNIFDLKIRKKIKRSRYPKSIESDKKIDALLYDLFGKEINEVRGVHFNPRKWVVACIIVLVLGLPVSVNAVIDFIGRRMEQISEEEQLDLYKEQQIHTSEEAFCYSRELSGEEKNKYEELLNMYEKEGLFPESELKRTNKLIGEYDYPVYIISERKIFLPNRNLGDEELLQIIDFYHIVDESLHNVTNDFISNEEIENEIPVSDDKLENTIIESSNAYLSGILQNNDFYQYETNVVYWDGEDNANCMYIVDYILNGESQYQVKIEPKSYDFLGFSINNEDILQHKGINQEDIDFNMIENKVADIGSKISNVEYDKEKSFVEYKVNRDGDIPSGNIRVYYALSNGDGYCFRYDLDAEQIWYIYYVKDLQQYKQMQTMKDTEYDESIGIKLIQKSY